MQSAIHNGQIIWVYYICFYLEQSSSAFDYQKVINMFWETFNGVSNINSDLGLSAGKTFVWVNNGNEEFH